MFVFQIEKLGVTEKEIDYFLSQFLFKPRYSYTHSQMIWVFLEIIVEFYVGVVNWQ